ncbi:hypothetical protein E8E11_001317 [Didymella keratinophila]|nr:hypothetical protein E8E11_001317 [Didymella keratinophila]
MRQRLQCCIDGENLLAIADSGSDVDVLSLSYVYKRRLKWQTTADIVELADGTARKACGRVVAQLSLGMDAKLIPMGRPGCSKELDERVIVKTEEPAIKPQTGPVRHVLQATFYVLDGITVDALVGARSIESLKLYTEHTEVLISRADEDLQDDPLYRIGLVGKIRTRPSSGFPGIIDGEPDHHGETLGSSREEQLKESDQRENSRRERAAAQALTISGAARVAFDLEEERKQRDNTKVAPDLAADGSSSPYTINISDWHDFNVSRRHLTMCLVTLHRAVLKYGDVNHNQALFHYHQACAAEILNHKIKTLGQLGPDPELFAGVSLFFFSQIQASAYGAWRAHLNAAKTLFNLWGVETLMGSSDYELQLCHLALADIFGAAMAPASHITAEDVKQHKVYLGLLRRFKIDVCSTMVPIPEAVVRSVATINISRAPKHRDVQSEQEQLGNKASTDAILGSLQAFDPTDWALQRPRHVSSQATSWALLATCFQAAAVLYLIRTSYTGTNQDTADLFYGRLTKCIRALYGLRQEGGTLYKYILWPMVVCGVEAILQSDEQQTKSLCELLEQTTMDLGTLSMREAAVFLHELWLASTQTVLEPSHQPRKDWDTIFAPAPLFLM